MRSYLIDSVINKATQIIKGWKINIDILDPVEQVLMLKVMGLISTDKLKIDSFGLSSWKIQEISSSYLGDSLKAYSNLHPETIDIVKNIKELVNQTPEDNPIDFDKKGWDRYLSKVGYVVSISGKSEELTKEAAIALRVLDATVSDKQELATKSLIEFAFLNKEYFPYVEKLGLKDFSPEHSGDYYTQLTPFIHKHNAEATRIKTLYDDSVRNNCDDDDLRIAASEHRILANLLTQAQITGDINNRCRYKNTALHRALYENDMDLAITLIDCGIDINAKHSGDGTAFGYALAWNQYPAVEALLKAGVNTHVITSVKKTLLENLIEKAKTKPEYQQLIDKYIPDVQTVNAFSTFLN